MSSCSRARGQRPSNKELRALETTVGLVRNTGGDIKVHLAYPNTYWVAMSNLGFQAVYGLFGSEEGVLIERAFLDEKALEESEYKLETKTFEQSSPLHECDVLGFSLSFETDYPHFVRMLGDAGILYDSHEARDAARDESPFPPPLILVGGTSATLNPEPIADFVDVVALGEAEEMIPELAKVLRQAKRDRLSREELFYALANIEGLYVPRHHTPRYGPDGTIVGFDRDPQSQERPRRRFVKDLSKFPTHTRILTPETEFKSMFLTETGRGCEMGCRFCVAGYIYRPVRKRSEESLAQSVDLGLESSKAVGFVGASVSSHRGISNLAKKVADAGARASLSSLMSQKVTKELAGSISESEYKTVALAPEAGSERLRRAAGKRVSNEQVITAATELAEAGIRGFKLYFIVGLPTETEEDTHAIATLGLAIRDSVVAISRGTGKTAWVQLSVNPFIPKASTPFQWEPMVSRKALERKIEIIKEAIKREHNIELRYESPKESYFQALLSRGDRRVKNYLYNAYLQKKDWKWILQNKHKELQGIVPPVSFFAERRIPYDEVLPWDIVDSRVDKKLLQREAMRAYHGESYGADERGEFDTSDEGITPDLVRGAIFG
jgi:radical SAM superfamily enzyme YgiQ (UPF0313 family)